MCSAAGVQGLDAEPANHVPQGDSDETAAANGRPSFETAIRLFHKRIYNLAYRLLGDFDEAADLTQETFVKAYKAYSRFRGTPEAVYPWLCQIAVNGCKDKFKKKSQRGRREILSLDESVEMGDSTMAFQVGDESANPASIYERRELEAKIQEAIQALPPEFRVVIVLRDMQGLSYKEIVDATGLTMETLKGRLFRGRAMLRRRLSPYIGIRG